MHRSDHQPASSRWVFDRLTAWVGAITLDFGVIALVTCPLLDTILVLRRHAAVVAVHGCRAGAHIGRRPVHTGGHTEIESGGVGRCTSEHSVLKVIDW